MYYQHIEIGFKKQVINVNDDNEFLLVRLRY